VCIFNVNCINLALTTSHGEQTSILQTKKLGISALASSGVRRSSVGVRRSSVRMRHIAQIRWGVDQLGSGVVQLR
jgi:hypothetical protein